MLKKDIKNQILKELIEAVQKDIAPWEKPWKTQILPPQNAISKRPYKGINLIRLFMLQNFKFKSADPRWCTFLQAKQQGWKIKKGARGTPIIFYEWKEKEYIFPLPENHTFTTTQDVVSFLILNNNDFYSLYKKFPHAQYHFNPQENALYVKISYPVLAVHYVFHASQIEGIPEFKPIKNNWNPVPIFEKLLKPTPDSPTLDIAYRDFACYSYHDDTIYLPLKEQFEDPLEFYSTLLHELCHSTMHSKRLKRYSEEELKELKKKENYAREELIAELGAFITSLKVKLSFNPNQTYAYCKSYIKKYLQKVKFKELYKIVSLAERIADWIIREFQLLPSEETTSKFETRTTTSTQSQIQKETFLHQ